MNKDNIESETVNDTFLTFFDTIKRLRAPDGCPWDIKQTPNTMREALLEECFEAIEAINNNDVEHVKEELGDIFLNTTMISYMYEQERKFTVQDVLNTVNEKLIRRHPHVFEESEGKVESIDAKTPDQVLNQWDNIKKNVEGRKQKYILDEVAKGLPALLRAYKLQKKAAKNGFDWKEVAPVFAKIREELAELEEALIDNKTLQTEQTLSHLEEEVGDLIFAVVNASRHLGIAPEIALARTNDKFYKRFCYVEKHMQEKEIDMKYEHLEQMDFFWEEAKKIVDKNPQK